MFSGLPVALSTEVGGGGGGRGYHVRYRGVRLLDRRPRGYFTIRGVPTSHVSRVRRTSSRVESDDFNAEVRTQRYVCEPRQLRSHGIQWRIIE